MGYAFGTYEHQIDAKGRMRIPAKIKSAFGEQMMVTTGIQGCLYVYPESKFVQIAEKIDNSLSSFDELDADAARLLGDAHQIDEDDQGRFTLPSRLREFAGLSKDVKDIVFVGIGSRVELWSAERWNAHKTEMNTKSGEINSRLKEAGL